MGTAERLVWGLLSLIALIGWCRWRGTPEDQKKDEPPQVPGKKITKRETSVISSRLSSFAADRGTGK
jgi:hypothetical protein